jgi:FKBP-type peptidyl-prolyl cis-trans isomerase
MQKKEMNIVIAVIIVLALIVVLVYISINNKTNMPQNTDNSTPLNYNLDNQNTTTPPGGQVAKTGDTVAMNYTGRLENGTVFDSNVDPKFNHVQPFVFTLGAGQVISGWDKGIVGMKVGETKTLTIPPEDAYGATGHPPVIPPNSTLIFEVELIAIK